MLLRRPQRSDYGSRRTGNHQHRGYVDTFHVAFSDVSMSAASETPVTSAGFGTKFGDDPSGTPLYHLLPVAGCYTDLAGTFIGVNSHGGVTLSALSSIEP